MRPGSADDEFRDNAAAIYTAIYNVTLDVLRKKYTGIVIPLDGIGTGLAELDVRAPRTFAFLQARLADLEHLFV